MNMSEVLLHVTAYYAKPGNAAGGCLHIVLDDGNVQDEHVKFCRDYAAQEGDEDGVALAELLLKMSVAQREQVFLADKGRMGPLPAGGEAVKARIVAGF